MTRICFPDIRAAHKICERFVGSEPLDAVTNAYNSALRQILPSRGIKVTELARMEKDGAPVSAKPGARIA